MPDDRTWVTVCDKHDDGSVAKETMPFCFAVAQALQKTGVPDVGIQFMQLASKMQTVEVSGMSKYSCPISILQHNTIIYIIR